MLTEKKLWNQFNLWLKEDDENVNESNQNNQNENKLNETNELAENKKNETNDASENKLINEVSTKENMEPGIGGANENVNLSQDEKDIVYIKEKADMLRPLEGVITSKYGKKRSDRYNIRKSCRYRHRSSLWSRYCFCNGWNC